MAPTHPDRLVENATAPSAGGFPDPDGEVRLRIRLPFRMTFSDPPFPLWLVGSAELWQGRVIVRKLSFLKEVG